MNLQELLKSYIGEDKLTEFMAKMKENKIFTVGEENLDTRYSKLKEDYDAKDKEHKESLSLIEELKKSSKGNEELSSKISNYENKLVELQKENEALKIDNAFKVELLGAKAKASDIDYLMFKFKQENKELVLDDDGKIKGLDVEKIKTQYPNNFEVVSKKEVTELNLPTNDGEAKPTKEEFNKMSYTEKAKLYKEDVELYNELRK